MDADLEYEPSDIPALLGPLRAGDAQAVFGTRGFQSHSAYSFWYVVGNRAVTFAANLLFNSWVSDMMTGQKAMSTELFRSLDLRAGGFAIEAEITARLLRRRRSHLRGTDHVHGSQPRGGQEADRPRRHARDSHAPTLSRDL